MLVCTINIFDKSSKIMPENTIKFPDEKENQLN